MTHKDIYTKFMIEYDKANITSSYPSLTKYEIATLLDKAYLALIAQKLTGNNTRKVAFEGDYKVIEDLRPLVKTQRCEYVTKENMFASNDVVKKLPSDLLYYLKSDILLNGIRQYTKLVDHVTADKFKATDSNLPWIKIPVSFIEGSNVHTFIDQYRFLNAFDSDVITTYIKKPISFVSPNGGEQESDTPDIKPETPNGTYYKYVLISPITNHNSPLALGTFPADTTKQEIQIKYRLDLYNGTQLIQTGGVKDDSITVKFEKNTSANAVEIKGYEVVRVSHPTYPDFNTTIQPDNVTYVSFEIHWKLTLRGATNSGGSEETPEQPSVPKYSIKFVDSYNHVLYEENLPQGSTPNPPEPPAKEGYRFVGWNPEISTVIGDVIYSPVYELNPSDVPDTPAKYWLKCYDMVNGSTIYTKQYEHNEMINVDEIPTPTRTGYTFTGWNPAIPNVMPNYDLTVCAQWQENTTPDGPNEPIVPDEPSTDEYVDLGLPSGVKFASKNLGANTSEEIGNYYSWGVTDYTLPHAYDPNVGFNDYLEYDIKNISGIREMDPSVELGINWRMPTENELKELLDYCTWTFDENKHGYLVKSKTNGKSIFIPAGGMVMENEERSVTIRKDEEVRLWSGDYARFKPFENSYYLNEEDDTYYEVRSEKSLFEGDTKMCRDKSRYLHYDKNNKNIFSHYKWCGLNIRPVYDESEQYYIDTVYDYEYFIEHQDELNYTEFNYCTKSFTNIVKKIEIYSDKTFTNVIRVITDRDQINEFTNITEKQATIEYIRYILNGDVRVLPESSFYAGKKDGLSYERDLWNALIYADLSHTNIDMIGPSAFKYSQLKYIKWSPNIRWICNRAFEHCGNLFNYPMEAKNGYMVLENYYENPERWIVRKYDKLPDSVIEEIHTLFEFPDPTFNDLDKTHMFDSQRSLYGAVKLPDTIMYTGVGVFDWACVDASGTQGMPTLILPKNLMGCPSFSHCSIFNLIAYDKLEAFPSGCLGFAANLTNVIVLGNSLKTIEYLSFNTCRSLRYITIPNSCTFINSSAFDYTETSSSSGDNQIPPLLHNYCKNRIQEVRSGIGLPATIGKTEKEKAHWHRIIEELMQELLELLKNPDEIIARFPFHKLDYANKVVVGEKIPFDNSGNMTTLTDRAFVQNGIQLQCKYYNWQNNTQHYGAEDAYLIEPYDDINDLDKLDETMGYNSLKQSKYGQSYVEIPESYKLYSINTNAYANWHILDRTYIPEEELEWYGNLTRMVDKNGFTSFNMLNSGGDVGIQSETHWMEITCIRQDIPYDVWIQK